MDGWKNKWNECGLELHMIVMRFVTAVFAVTVHWPSTSGRFRAATSRRARGFTTLCCLPVPTAWSPVGL